MYAFKIALDDVILIFHVILNLLGCFCPVEGQNKTKKVQFLEMEKVQRRATK